MFRPCVPEDLVLDDLEAELMSFVDHRAVVVQRPESRVGVVEIDRAVSVKVGHLARRSSEVTRKPRRRRAVQRREPDRSDAQVGQVWEPTAEASKIAAMVCMGVAAVEQAIAARRVVVLSVPVSKTVDHDQVDHIVWPERLRPPGRSVDQFPLARKVWPWTSISI